MGWKEQSRKKVNEAMRKAMYRDGKSPKQQAELEELKKAAEPKQKTNGSEKLSKRNGASR